MPAVELVGAAAALAEVAVGLPFAGWASLATSNVSNGGMEDVVSCDDEVT